jgi:DHA2 family multidrug resistance protein
MTPINSSNPTSAPVVNPWIVAITVMTSTFMEVLDTTVVNVSLPHIAGSLSSTPSEATWALTSYLVANAIILPMTGWLANYFGRKRLLMASVTGFTLSSFFCGFAPNLPFLIFFRVIQGATGGGLQPLSQAILLEVFPPRERGKAMAFWALGIVVAPMLGPVLGGWLTDAHSWRWVFYINVPIGILSLIMTYIFVFDPPYIKRLTSKIDYWGIGLLAVGIGALQIMLDKGQEDNWFSSRFITILAILAGCGLLLFVIRELVAEHPVVDLTVFRNRSYATGVFLMTVLGFVLYGSTVLVPLLMQTLLGYPALQAGIAMLPRGLGSFLMMPLVGFLMSKIEARRLLGTGILVATFSFWNFSHLSLDVGYWNFFWPLIIQGSAMGFLFVPLTTITNDQIPKEKMGNATSLFNLMRNIGASIGIAVVVMLQSRRAQQHINHLSAHVNPYNPITQNRVSELVAFLMKNGGGGGGNNLMTATHQAYAILFAMVERQASIMSYNDVFGILSITFAAMFPLIFLMQKPKHAQGGGEAAMH